MPVIYIDLLFLINFLLDTVLLMMTGRLSGRTCPFYRAAIGGLFGGFYGVSIFFAHLEFLEWGVISAAAACIMVAICFCPVTKKDFVRLVLSFYLAAFLMCGALSIVTLPTGKAGIISNGVYYFPLSTAQLLFFALPFSAAVVAIWKKAKNRLLSYGKFCTVTIFCNEKKLETEGLIDSGCFVTDPYFNKPVIIIDPEMAKKLLSDLPEKFRLIPYRTVNSEGYMKGFTPEKCSVKTDKGTFICDCTVAVSPDFSGGKAIVNPEILLNRRNENDLQVSD